MAKKAQKQKPKKEMNGKKPKSLQKANTKSKAGR